MGSPDFSIEQSFRGHIAGVDEAGRGPWAGPVVAAAVIFHSLTPTAGINDSKKLDASAREKLFDLIQSTTFYGIGIAEVNEIDTFNILQATHIAMRRAIQCLPVLPDVALIDGNSAPALACQTHTIIEGDAKSLSIAAASILAKVTRDRIMRRLALDYPGYGWDTNMGYGTPEHQYGMSSHGITMHHRRSFSPVRAFLEATDLFAA